MQISRSIRRPNALTSRPSTGASVWATTLRWGRRFLLCMVKTMASGVRRGRTASARRPSQTKSTRPTCTHAEARSDPDAKTTGRRGGTSTSRSCGAVRPGATSTSTHARRRSRSSTGSTLRRAGWQKTSTTRGMSAPTPSPGPRSRTVVSLTLLSTTRRLARTALASTGTFLSPSPSTQSPNRPWRTRWRARPSASPPPPPLPPSPSTHQPGVCSQLRLPSQCGGEPDFVSMTTVQVRAVWLVPTTRQTRRHRVPEQPECRSDCERESLRGCGARSLELPAGPS
mmetsp:Transcript_39905/g.80442  ORF Transcript_39905/g.80442 Transcript_39905/m.80442 type:complete len:284 (-) Transcript_39905:47-898(-)